MFVGGVAELAIDERASESPYSGEAAEQPYWGHLTQIEISEKKQ